MSERGLTDDVGAALATVLMENKHVFSVTRPRVGSKSEIEKDGQKKKIIIKLDWEGGVSAMRMRRVVRETDLATFWKRK